MEKSNNRIIFVMPDSPDHDIRIFKEAKSLKKAGYEIKLLYWDRECNNNTRKREYDEEKCLRFKAPQGITLIPFLPVWWSFVLLNLLMKKWDVVHVLNFHSIIPSLIAGKLKRKSVIYEILDVYAEGFPKIVRAICMWLDKLFMHIANGIVIADEAQIKGVGGIPNRNIVTIYDSPPDIFHHNITNRFDHQTKEDFTLFYAGVLIRKRQLNLEKVVKAIKAVEGIKLVIAGYGDLAEEIREMSHQIPNKIEFIGKISYEEVINRGLNADLFFVLRDHLKPTHIYTCGSTIFNAMRCGKPILVNQGTSTTRIVMEENCGLAVDSNNTEEIRGAILKLRDNPQLCKELGENARRAYEQKYDWKLMEQRMVTFYRNLN